VLVTVKAVSVNPVDWKVAAGALKALPNFALPQTPGGDIAGSVAALGEGVEGLAVGDAVYAFIGLTGAYAEQVAVSATSVARKPENLSFEEAAAMPLAALTAWQGLLADGRDLTGLHVMVHGAAGGVGVATVQIAKAKGARVTATASAKNAALIQALGADAVVDYRATPVAQAAKDVDIVLDCVGDSLGFSFWTLINAPGTLARVAAGRDDTKPAEAAGVKVLQVRVQPNAGQLGELAALAQAGEFQPVVAKLFALDEVRDAWALSREGHTVGKIVMTV
jgi:NADPH:quinone reductase-like Zn-dependent oxidoreductase